MIFSGICYISQKFAQHNIHCVEQLYSNPYVVNVNTNTKTCNKISIIC